MSPTTVSNLKSQIISFVRSISKSLLLLTIIAAFLALSVYISGEFFGTHGFEKALGLLLAGGILSMFATAAKSRIKAASFRTMAYLGTAAFMAVAYAGMKKSSVFASNDYIASQKAIARIETEMESVSKSIAGLPADHITARSKEYERMTALKAELAEAHAQQQTVRLSSNDDLAIAGDFVVRFILDIVIFALFELFAATFLVRRREDFAST